MSSRNSEVSSKYEIVFIVLFVAIFAGLVFFASYWFVNRKPASSAEQSPTPAQIEPKVYEVALDSTKSDDVNMQITSGDYVQFNPQDGKEHQIVQSGEGEHGGEKLDSGVFTDDQDYKVRFSDEGEYILKDLSNPNSKIRIDVRK